MKFYSEKLDKMFDNEKDLIKAEDAHDVAVAAEKAKQEKLSAERKDRAHNIEEAYKKVEDARKEYNKLVEEFVRDYGSFHMTYKGNDGSMFNLFEKFFEF